MKVVARLALDKHNIVADPLKQVTNNKDATVLGRFTDSNMEMSRTTKQTKIK